MFIRVTAEDIEDGVRKDAHQCPLARALKRRTGDDTASVNGEEFCFYKETGVTHRRMSGSTQRFVENFDRGQRVRPGIYWI